jgi:antitoxin component of RelBE/YafQ-DinJ toxin-antitoxin module
MIKNKDVARCVLSIRAQPKHLHKLNRITGITGLNTAQIVRMLIERVEITESFPFTITPMAENNVIGQQS